MIPMIPSILVTNSLRFLLSTFYFLLFLLSTLYEFYEFYDVQTADALQSADTRAAGFIEFDGRRGRNRLSIELRRLGAARSLGT